MDRQAQITVPRAWGGRLLLDLLAERFTYHQRDEWERLLREGAVRVNGSLSSPDVVLKPGDAVEYLVPDVPEPRVATDYHILYGDEAVLVVDKPADLPCHPAGQFFRNTLWALLRRDLGGVDLLFTNRLDRETSGIVLIARTSLAARRLGQPSRRRTMVKEYLAIVEGAMREPVHARGWLVTDPLSALRKKQRFLPETAGAEPPEGSQAAETWFEPVRQGGDLTLVRARLGTGRTHQIRATLLALGFPLVGDKVYGRDETLYIRFIEKTLTPEDHRLLRLDRQALHACRLRFQHPLSDAILDLESPMPADLARLLAP
jgi:23S rRNA pseudouridine955/2504/2580 synthase/23S rRNA pseudouridine1911/1915/1917 synthase